MRVRYGAVALPTVAMGAFLLVGCNPSNEENLGGQTSKVVPHKEGMPDFKTYAEVQQYQTQQAAKNRSAGKGKASAKPATKQSEPESQKDQPKSQ
jgi:hypothetical protein